MHLAVSKAKATQDKKGKKTENAKDRRLEDGWRNNAQMDAFQNGS